MERTTVTLNETDAIEVVLEAYAFGNRDEALRLAAAAGRRRTMARLRERASQD